MTANVQTMAYVGKTPWHGLGNKLTDGLSIEQWLIEAGMNYELLQTAPMFEFNGEMRSFTDKGLIYRSDNGQPISIMSGRYKIVQPAEVLEFFRDLCDDLGYALETAGVLGDGAKYWALARTGRSADLGNTGDMLDDYVLLATSADGTMATTGMRTSVRVVCQNTLGLALHSGDGVKVSHRSQFDPTDVKQRMGLIDAQAWTDFVADIDRLIATPVTPTVARDFWLAVNEIDLTDSDKMTQHKQTRIKNGLQTYAGNIKSAPGHDLESADRTLWGLVNAITYETDHQGKSRSDSNRLNSAWFGAGNATKNRAFDIALSMADGADVVEASRIIDGDKEVIVEERVETKPDLMADIIAATMARFA